MKDLFKKNFSIPGTDTAEKALRTFTIGERLIFLMFVLITMVATFFLLLKISDNFSITRPTKGGTFTEGIIGSPRFINPVLAISDADRDLSVLLFSGLMRPNADGFLEPDLAEYYEISADGLIYNFKIRDDAFFHDGEEITADDVIFTIEKTKDPAIKSPKRAEWEGVQINKIDEKTISFVLPKPYYPFIENTTIGIIPKHIWEGVSSEEFPFSLQNIDPIGSGPFFIKNTNRNKAGIPISYELKAFRDYSEKSPHLNSINIIFFKNEADAISAWQKNTINSLGGISAELAKNLEQNKEIKILNFNLPRIFGVFLNQNQTNLFTDKNLREALNISIDRKKIVEENLFGYGNPLYSPIPENLIGNTPSSQEIIINQERANALLEKSGWNFEDDENVRSKIIKKEKVYLTFSISAPNVPELKSIGESLIQAWQEIGVKVELKLFDLGDLNQNVIRPRRYEALLFGEVIGRNPDLTAFWHSSQRNDPGYNIALYTNTKTDKILEQLRIESNPETRAQLLNDVAEKISADIPAIFLYSPDYLYLPPKNIQGLKTGLIASPSERFSEIKNWYVETEKIWPILNRLINLSH